MNNNIQVIIKSSTSEMSLNDHSAGIYIVPELNGLTGLPNIRTTSGVNAGYDGGWTTAQNYDARSITIRGTIANEDKSEVERMRRELTSLLGQGKSEQLTLDIVTETGKAYEIQVRTISCEMAMQKVLTRQDFMIQLRADDPLIYDITESGEPVILQVQQALGGFQIDFELPLAIGGSEDAGIIDNHGLEEVYPIVKMYGALHNPKIINQTTNQSMQINADLGFAEGTYFDPVSTEDGTLLNFNSPYNAPLDKLDIKGNTTQQTYTGKNLLKVYRTSATATSNGITCTYNPSEQSLSFNGTCSTDNTTFNFAGNDFNLISGTTKANAYYVSGSVSGYCRARFFDSNYGGIVLNLADLSSSNKIASLVSNSTFTLDHTRASIRFESGSVVSNFKIKFMVADSADTTYEPYVGGVPAPNPDYPQPVQTTTGYNEVKICGKNLLDSSSFINAYYDDSGTMHTNANANALFNNYIFVQPSTSYTYSSSHSNRNMAVSYFTSSFTFISRDIARNGNKLTFTTPNNCVCIRLQANYDDSTTMNESVVQSMNLQLELGSTDTSFEAYQGQSYEVNLGKNLYPNSQDFGGNNWINSGDWATDSSTYDDLVVKKRKGTWSGLSEEISVESGRTYTFSVFVKADAARDVLIYLAKTGGASTSPDSKRVTVTTSWQRYSLTFTATSSGVIRARVENDTDNGSYTYICGYQLELGPATAYAPYFTPIELCKIGTYQDYIYKDGNDWKIYKTIAKKIYNGTETWTKSQYGTNNYLSPNVSPTPRQFPESLLNIISNSFVGISYTDRTVSTQNITYITSNSIWIRNTSFSTATEVSDYFSNNSAVFYYIMATPTDTTITYAPLIEQLEALASSAKAYAPVTNIGTQIATGNALPILNATYYTDKDPDVRDEVIIDSRLKTITLNGLDIYHLKTPGSEFLMLAPGQNKLILQSDNTSDNGYAEVNYKQGYLSI